MKKIILPLIVSFALISNFANASITEPNALAFQNTVSMYSYDEHAMPLESGKTFVAADQEWVSSKFSVVTTDDQVYHLTLPTLVDTDKLLRLHIQHEVKISDFKDTSIKTVISGKEASIRVSTVDGYRLYSNVVTRYTSYDFNISIQLEPYTYVQFGYEMPQSLWSRTQLADVVSNDYTDIAGTTPPSLKSVYESAEKYLDVISRIKVEKIK